MTLLPYGWFGLCNDFKRHLKTHLLAVLMTYVTQRLGGGRKLRLWLAWTDLIDNLALLH